MAGIAGPERSNIFLVRCNFEPSTPLREVAELISTPERSFRIATDELLGSMGELIARIEHGDGPEAALRELWATLLGLTTMVARDPGIRMAAEDLHAAATALVSDRSLELTGVDVRRRRLLKEAHARLRDRLATAKPNAQPRLSNLN